MLVNRLYSWWRRYLQPRRFRQRSRWTTPLLEALERRIAPATLLVNSLLDNTTPGDGLVTLREAILASNNHTMDDLGQTGTGNDIINFAPGLTGTIALTLGELDINDNLTITGPGANVLSIDGSSMATSSTSHLFNIATPPGTRKTPSLSTAWLCKERRPPAAAVRSWPTA